VLKGEIGETYNIGGKCEMKNIDVVHALIAAVNAERPDLKRDPKDLITFVKDRPGRDRRYRYFSGELLKHRISRDTDGQQKRVSS
jgi:dTDP-glucose 4,6-dehydratase